jgi:hypothetical protein
MKIYSCKCHNKIYTVCHDCGCQYCTITWNGCPRTDWHPSHGATAEDIARRYQTQDMNRRQGEANRLANDARIDDSKVAPLARFMESR